MLFPRVLKTTKPAAGTTGPFIFLVAGTGNQRYLRLVERNIPRLAA